MEEGGRSGHAILFAIVRDTGQHGVTMRRASIRPVRSPKRFEERTPGE